MSHPTCECVMHNLFSFKAVWVKKSLFPFSTAPLFFPFSNSQLRTCTQPLARLGGQLATSLAGGHRLLHRSGSGLKGSRPASGCQWKKKIPTCWRWRRGARLGTCQGSPTSSLLGAGCTLSGRSTTWTWTNCFEGPRKRTVQAAGLL